MAVLEFCGNYLFCRSRIACDAPALGEPDHNETIGTILNSFSCNCLAYFCFAVCFGSLLTFKEMSVFVLDSLDFCQASVENDIAIVRTRMESFSVEHQVGEVRQLLGANLSSIC